MSGGVAGSTPWPRLKMCPGGAAPAQHVGGVALDLAGRPKQHRGVEVALDGDTVAELVPGAVEGVRQSSPTTSPPAAPTCASMPEAPPAKWMTGTPLPETAASTCATCGWT